MLGAVLLEVQIRVLEDGDEIGKPLNLGRSFAELVRAIEVGKVAASHRELASIMGGITCVLILLPMSLSPLRETMSLKLAHMGIVTCGAKSSESPYLSEMYLTNGMNRT